MPNIKRQAIIVFSLLVVVSAIFFLYPSLDLKTAHLFFSQHQFEAGRDIGANFIRAPIFRLSTHVVSALTIIVSAGALLVAIIAFKKRNKTVLISAVFIMLCFGLGPGLLVNGILKAFWGRPRPFYVDGFGYHLMYVRVWEISNECMRNCSFVAGDSSAALTFIAFAFLPWARRWKILVAVLASLFFIYNGILRVIHGAHFLSDVMIGGLLVYLVILGCYQFSFGFLARKITFNPRSA